VASTSQNDKKTKRSAAGGGLTYGQSLEIIGRYFDQQNYRGVFVAEGAEGFVGKARPAAQDVELRAEGFSFPFDDLRARAADPPTPPIPVEDGPPFCPDGYAVFMSMIGDWCDKKGGSLVSLLEMTTGFILSYTESHDGMAVRQRLVLDRAAIEDMMSSANSF